MVLKLATVWEGIAVYVTATGEAFSLTKRCGLRRKSFNENALGRHAKKYRTRYYKKLCIGTSVSGTDKYKNFWFHILVCTAFHGPRPTPKHQVDHINRDKWDNRPENLRWVTCHENHMNGKLHLQKLERLRLQQCAQPKSAPVQLQLSFNY